MNPNLMMTKFICLGLLLLAFNITCKAQWTEIEPDTIGVFRAIKFKNQSEGLILGNNGIILNTSNQGESWGHLPNDLKVDFFDFQFINDTMIYAYGSDKIYMSTDFGGSWNEKSSLPAKAQFAYFIDLETGFAGGNIDGLRRTENGGDTWDIVWTHPGEDAGYSEQNDIDFINDSVGFACGRALRGGAYGNIIKTVDRGLTWSIVFEGLSSYQTNHPKKIQILNDSTIVAIDEYFDLIRTHDFGETWSVVLFNEPDPGTWFGMTASSMYCINHDTVLACAETTVWLTKSGCHSKRKILRTTNGGENWIVQYLEDVQSQGCGTPLMGDITFINDTTGISVGSNLILRTINLGGDPHIRDTIIFGGIEDRSQYLAGVTVFPNPTTTYLTVEINNDDYITLDIYSVSGKKIGNSRLKQFNTIDLTAYSAGVYILRFSGKRTYYHRIIKTEQ